MPTKGIIQTKYIVMPHVNRGRLMQISMHRNSKDSYLSLPRTATPWHRWSFTSLSPWRPWLNPRSHMGCGGKKWNWDGVFSFHYHSTNVPYPFIRLPPVLCNLSSRQHP